MDVVSRGGRPKGTTIRPHHLAEMKKMAEAGATWAEMAKVYPYHASTIMRAITLDLAYVPILTRRKNVRFSLAQAEAIEQYGGTRYLRALVDRDITARKNRD
ncbi:MAG: hypothetical protein KBA75_10380 [Alphaproteobacteria bacterium]|nr:hypothetical protein [Alphaproteobacteria bacterium]